MRKMHVSEPRVAYSFIRTWFVMAEESTNKPTTRRTERIAKYEIVGHIATGGMGVIYKAHDVDLDRPVALKILPPDLAAQQTTLIRFQREAKAAAQLRHENIVSIYDVGESNGTYYIALEYIDGTDLQDYINRKCRLDPEEARQIIIQAARALGHAHEKGIVHRDIKPSNFLLTQKTGRLIVKLTDFGLAIRHENDAEFRITRDKTTVGTVDYMSPEQARDSRSADIRSDIYSLGCTFYHMLAGLAPFGRGTLPERLIQHMKTPPPDVRKLNKGVPEPIVAIINRMLAKKPDDRYQTPAELLRDLENPDKVAVPGRRSATTGKLERASGRRPPNDPTQVIDQDRLDEAPEEPKQAKTLRVKKNNVAVENKVKEPDSRWPAGEPERGLDDSAPEISQKKGPKSQAWLITAAGAVGVLGLVLIIALIFGGRTPPAPPPPDDKPKPQPRVEEKKEPNVEKRPPALVVDTSPEKMTVMPPVLPIMDVPPEKADRAALRREFAGPFTSFPAAPPQADVVRMSRLAAPAPNTYRTLAAAFASVKPDVFTVIEIHDNGPIYVPSLTSLTDRSILVRGGEGFRPLIVWDEPSKPSPKTPAPTVFCTLRNGKLMLANLDIVIRRTDGSAVALFDLPESDFHAHECTFSIAGKSKDGIALVRRGPTKSATPKALPTQTWLKRCYVRGADMALLRHEGVSGDVLIDESLIVGYQHPLIDLRGRDQDKLDLHCVRSSLVAGQVLLRWQSLAGNGVNPQLQMKSLDSILSRDDTTAPVGDMIQLADGAGHSKLTWKAVNTVYAGWKHLLASDSKSIAGADRKSWQSQWGSANGDHAVVDTFPATPPPGLEEQTADAFLPAHSQVAFAALTGPGAAGAVVGWLPPAPESWIERAYEPRPVAHVPDGSLKAPDIGPAVDGLYHGESLDLTKVDLGAYLTGKLQRETPAPRVVLHLKGKGTVQTSQLRVRGVQQLVLYFERDLKDPLTLEASAVGSENRSALIDMDGGQLELIGARLRLSPATVWPSIISVQDGSLTLTRCLLQGPHSVTPGFKYLITIANTNPSPTTLLLRDCALIASPLLVQMQDNVQVKARNNLLVAPVDAVVMDVKPVTGPLQHIFDHNTFAVRQTFFTMRPSAAAVGAGSVLLHANSNAFLNPFADSSEKATLLRGADAWTARGRWSWQGRYNVYDTRLHAYFGFDKTTGAKQTRLDWQAVWGQPGEQEPIVLADAKALKTITPDGATQAALLLQLDRLTLPADILGDREQTPPGADLVGLGIRKKN